MKNQKTVFILPKGYIRYIPNPRSRDYGIYIYNSEKSEQLKPILSDKNTILVINSDLASMPEGAKKRDAVWEYTSVFGKLPPMCDVIFNQDQFHHREYDIRCRNWEYTPVPIRDTFLDQNTTMTFNGIIDGISISSYNETCLFNHFIFNNTKKPDEGNFHQIDISNNYIKSLTFDNFDETRITLECNNLEHLNLSNFKQCHIDKIVSNKIEEITLPEIDFLNIEISRFRTPNLKLLDMSGVKKLDFLSLYDLLSMFPSLETEGINKFSNINSRSKYIDIFNNFKKEITEWNEKRLSIDCKFIVGPDTILRSDVFPTKWDEENHEVIYLTAKEIFPVNKDGKVEFNLADLITMTFNESKKHMYDQMDRLDSFINNKENFKNIVNLKNQKPKEQTH